MSGDIVNLRRVRKAAACAGRATEAAAARARHGRTGGERAAKALEAGRATRLLNGAKLDGVKLDEPRREPAPPADAE